MDVAQIFRFAPKLNAHQLRGACAFLTLPNQPTLTTEAMIEYLRSQKMASNVQLGEVQAVDLRALKGVDDLIEALEANMCCPSKTMRWPPNWTSSPSVACCSPALRAREKRPWAARSPIGSSRSFS
jgi:hypothetical protein